MNDAEICTTTAGSKQHLSANLADDPRSPRQPGRWGRTLCGHYAFDQDRADHFIADQLIRPCKPIADLPPCRSCLNAAGRPGEQAFRLTTDQVDALRALLGLVHYDDLADALLAILPIDFHPSRGQS